MFDTMLASTMALDLSQFLVATWAKHPDLIPNEVGDIISEPVQPFVEREPSLFIRSLGLIHLWCDTLQFWVFVRVLEVHDYTIPKHSSDDPFDPSGDSGADGIPGP
jgi:hypothetical protein